MFSETKLPSFSIEKQFCTENVEYIAGVDEAGRGALAGPLGVGLVIYKKSYFDSQLSEEFQSINDSKKLNLEKREQAFQVIKKNALISLYTSIPVEIIDKENINNATFIAIKELVKKSQIKPDLILMDGNFKFNFNVPIYSIKKGDQLSLSIASASIVAKVTRDKLMHDYDKMYPEYGLKKHKGYGTSFHREKILELGGTPIHRTSYDPLKTMINSANEKLLF